MNSRLKLLAAFFLQLFSAFSSKNYQTSEKKRLLSFSGVRAFLGASLLVVGGSGVGFGQYAGTGTFTKITSLAELTNGYYVVAYGTSQGMRNTHDGTLLPVSGISVSGGTTITNPNPRIVWKIETHASGGYTIYNDSLNKFVSYSGSSNNIQIVSSVVSGNQRWNISYTSSLFVFQNAAVTARFLRYNSSSPRFVCYTSAQNDLTLYKYNPPTYTITYNGNSQTSGTPPTDATAYASGATVTVLGNTGALTKTGFTFSGWNAATDGSGTNYAPGSTFSIAANTTLYAKWIASSGFNVTFNGNGSTGGSTAAQNASSPTALTSNGFTRAGYTFTGWNTLANGSGTAYANGATYVFDSDVTLYAQWSANNNTLSFDGNGSTSGSTANQTIATDASATLTTNGFSRTGYTFSGWNTLANGTGTAYANGASYTMGSANATLYAQWTANTYTVTFDGNGSTGGSTAAQSANSSTALTTNGFTRTGYTFVGWNTIAGGGGTAYVDGAAYGFTSDVTLYAQWTVYTGPVSKTYKLITSTSDLEVGKKYLIVNSASDGAANALSIQNTNNRGVSSILIVAGSPNQITTTAAGSSSGTEPYEFTLGGSTGAWTLYDAVNSGYLYATNGSNTLRNQASLSNWTISISSDVATIQQIVSGETRTIKYNSGSSIFSCYTTGQNSIYLYKEDCALSAPVGVFETGSSSCGSTEIKYTGTIPSGETFYWQTAANGTSTTYAVTSGSFFNAPTAGTWYVRSNINSCWSPALTGSTLTVSQAPSITTQPADATVVAGNTANFSVVASNAIGYQWQVSTNNGGSWNNVSTGTGATTASYTTENATSGMNTYRYRVIVSATAPCSDVVSNGSSTLTVANASVNVISNQSSVYGSSPSFTPTATGAVSSWSATLPAGLSINTSTGAITGTITEDVMNSPFSSSVTASFTAGGSDTKNFTWTITQKPLTITGLTGTNKVYDGNTAATLSGTASLSGIVGSDVATISGSPTATFVNKNVGNGKAITISGYSLSGADAGNYTLTQPAASANITAKPLSVTGATASNKPYDGNTTATITGATLVGLVGSDVVTVSGGGTFADPNAANGIVVTPVLSLSGADAGNYTLTQPTGLTANITKINPVITVSPININVGGNYALPGANITSTSGGAFTYSITGGGNATLSGTTLTGAVVGTETLTVNQAASTNYNTGIATVVVNVTTVTFLSGDYRSTGTGLWNPAGSTGLATWERYDGTSWNVSAAPATNTTNNLYIRNGDIVTSGTSIGNTVKIFVQDGGRYISQHNSTASTVYIFSGGIFEFKSNLLRINTLFEIEDGGTFIYDYSANSGEGLALWNGEERFHPNSNFIVKNSKTGAGNYFIPVDGSAAGQINSNTYNGTTAYFGNLTFDASVKDIRLTTNSLTGSTITHGNLEFRPNYIGGGAQTLIYGNLTWTIGGNLIIGQNTIDAGSTSLNITTGANTITWNVKGNLINSSGNTFRVVNNASGNVTVNVDGNVSLTSGTVDLNGAAGGQGTVKMKGNFYVASGASYIASNSTTATTIFSGGNVQDVSGAGTIDVYYMEINKSGGKVNLLRDLKAQINLKMIAGNLYTNANLFELGLNSTQTGTLTYTSGYVLGNMKRWFGGLSAGTDTKDLFPLGFDDNGIKNRFAKIQFTGGTPSGALTAFFVGSPMGSQTIPILVGSANSAPDITFDITSTENQGYWNISVSSGTFSASEVYTATLLGQGFTTITDLSKLVLLKRPTAGIDWFVPGTSGTGTSVTYGSTAIPAVQRLGIGTFSDFGFGGADVNPLPVELLSFSANCESGNAVANWSTASEKNSDYFILQSSQNMENWTEVAVVAGAGNSSQQIDYSATDFNSIRGLSYYRLVQVDYDGNIKSYAPISVNCSDAGSEFLKVYPNPSDGEFSVEWNMESLSGTVLLSLTSSTGALISEKVIQAVNGKHMVPFSEKLESGIYYVTVKADTGKETLKLVVK